jgi:pyroglutamyl-peptidase
MPVALLSGFDVWGDHATNSSWEAVKAANPVLPSGWRLRKVKLPVSWEKCYMKLAEVWSPEVGAVIACGMAATDAIRVEKIAINLTDPDACDADGQTAPSAFVIPDTPAAYYSGLPVAGIFDALTKEGIPVEMSSHCGTYLCNFIFYSIMHRIELGGLRIPGGFLHVPSPGRSIGDDIEQLARAVAIATEASVALTQ